MSKTNEKVRYIEEGKSRQENDFMFRYKREGGEGAITYQKKQKQQYDQGQRISIQREGIYRPLPPPQYQPPSPDVEQSREADLSNQSDHPYLSLSSHSRPEEGNFQQSQIYVVEQINRINEYIQNFIEERYSYMEQNIDHQFKLAEYQLVQQVMANDPLYMTVFEKQQTGQQ